MIRYESGHLIGIDPALADLPIFSARIVFGTNALAPFCPQIMAESRPGDGTNQLMQESARIGMNGKIRLDRGLPQFRRINVNDNLLGILRKVFPVVANLANIVSAAN